MIPISKENRKLLEQIKANIARLDDCPIHSFVRIDPTHAWSRMRCTVCCGEVDSIHAHYYALGLEHGRRTPHAGRKQNEESK